jgi:LAO/AO transport system kinase
VLVLTPNTGDGIQTIKAGIMEIADLFVVNKCDLPGADRTLIEIETMLNMKTTEMKWRPPVVETSAFKETGIDGLFDAIESHGNYLRENDIYNQIEKERASSDMLDILMIRWRQLVDRNLLNGGPADSYRDQVLKREMDPYTAAGKIMEYLINPLCKDE